MVSIHSGWVMRCQLAVVILLLIVWARVFRGKAIIFCICNYCCQITTILDGVFKLLGLKCHYYVCQNPGDIPGV